VIDHVGRGPAFVPTTTRRLTYGFQSYISMPIVRPDGSFFGTLCAIDPVRQRSKPESRSMFELVRRTDRLPAGRRGALRPANPPCWTSARPQLRDQFIAVLGHDLRNPLAAVQAGAALLRTTPLSDKAAGIVDQMQDSGERMSRLINDVLDFARGRLGGGLPVAPRRAVQMGPVLEQVIGELRSGHAARIIRTELALDRLVACDPDRIGQLLSNLLGNALSHGDPDGEVAVCAISDEDGFTLSVANTGAPIPAGARSELFKPFSRLKPGEVREGLGLGLYIASQIALAHGGRIEVVSDQTETRFTFRMPSA
jgi:signal transduction histidine kinase